MENGVSNGMPGRYSRQVLFGGIGEAGQARIMRSRVAVVGCGALGAMQASLLARAGVGTLRVIDRDFVEESNLQRQVLFDEADVRDALPKAAAAERKLRAVNSLIAVEGVVDDVNATSIGRLLDGFDLILDAADNFNVRFLVNEYAVKNKVPWIYGACVGAYGLTFPVLPGEGACLRCVFESAPPPGASPSCDTAGVIGPVVGAVASFQVAEALKLLAGARDRLRRKITTFDLWENRYDSINLPEPFADCACCGRHEYPFLEGEAGEEVASLCGRNSVQIRPKNPGMLDLEGLAARLGRLGRVERNKFLLRASIDGHSLTVFSDGRAIVQGTYDESVAKSIYARYVGG
ncbi:MAG: ThiF family adenylyltransferase [Acidobacteriota bacterium]|jgi:adenylyltransferase/sulfurtransferase|nr:ThiF family adenylyltransferase [Acidobacteriota bacterium]